MIRAVAAALVIVAGCGSDMRSANDNSIRTTEFTNQAGQHCTQLVSSNALALDCVATSSSR